MNSSISAWMSSRLGFLFKIVIVVWILGTDDGVAAKHQCPNKCGNISISYPFGIGKHCYKNKWFEITCQNRSSNLQQVPILHAYQLKILNLSSSEVRVAYTWKFSNCYPSNSGVEYGLEQVIGPFNREEGVPNTYTFSHINNKFVAIGCDVYSFITNPNSDNYTTGCLSICQPQKTMYGFNEKFYQCAGVLCCQTAIPVGLESFRVSIINVSSVLLDRFAIGPPHGCARAFLAEHDFYDYNSHYQDIPVRLTWVVGRNSCIENQRTNGSAKSSYACTLNTDCIDNVNGYGYHCSCSQGYQGNAYLPNGCQDIDECKIGKARCGQHAECENTAGAYYCSCPKGYHGDGTPENGCIADKRQPPLPQIVSIGITVGLISAVILISGMLFSWRFGRQRQLKQRQMFFRRNGGLLLQQQIASHKGAVGTTKIFGIQVLDRATDNFDAGRIRGTGGFCSLYKGMLPDGEIVAIKKARIMDESQVAQFINEVVILSQINHRNIVKIALDIAGALAYLHSAVSTSIFHRDVKSTNILLDENYNAIVADFGLSRSIPIDTSHLTTQVHGTFGYLDPEYFHSSQFTEKSDVYSFGVVLVELLTGEKAVSSTKFEEEKSLVMNFISAVKENRLFQILEGRVSNEIKKKRC
ncbi:hypothetical protein LWI29_032966 [Acer saccharum]|uniref:Uncharacterized protein n=1 Tax=Acer saccharum TaxID=4024 RepID=A0AA39VF28_ACESA|nr:hypothetical protein LWI29_032966 [Acer saccharum]